MTARLGIAADHNDQYLSKMDVMQGFEDNGETSEVSGESDDDEDSVYQITASVKEDMRKLDGIFQEKGMRYRLIDRIGEGH